MPSCNKKRSAVYRRAMRPDNILNRQVVCYSGGQRILQLIARAVPGIQCSAAHVQLMFKENNQ